MILASLLKITGALAGNLFSAARFGCLIRDEEWARLPPSMVPEHHLRAYAFACCSEPNDRLCWLSVNSFSSGAQSHHALSDNGPQACGVCLVAVTGIEDSLQLASVCRIWGGSALRTA